MATHWKTYFGQMTSLTSFWSWQSPSILLNPTLDEKHIEGELKKDPSSGRAEWLAEWREDIEDFLSLEQIQAVVAPRGELPPEPHLQYRGFTDPSGGRADAFALGIGHKDGEHQVVDFLKAWDPPFDPSEVVQQIAEICKQYRVTQLVGDKYGGAWVETAFQKVGLSYQASALPKSDLYLNFEPLVNTRKVELPDDERLINELRSLERRRGRSGLDIVDHPPMKSARDDMGNSVAGLCWLLQEKRETGPSLVGFIDPLTGTFEQPTHRRPRARPTGVHRKRLRATLCT